MRVVTSVDSTIFFPVDFFFFCCLDHYLLLCCCCRLPLLLFLFLLLHERLHTLLVQEYCRWGSCADFVVDEHLGLLPGTVTSLIFSPDRVQVGGVFNQGFHQQGSVTSVGNL